MTMQQEWESLFLANYATPSLQLVKGQGSRVWDSDGNSYLDLVAGIAVSSLGHAHPAVVSAVSTQVGLIAHTSNLYANSPAIALAKKLQDLAGQPCKVFFCNDGATANEAAFKLARKHGKGRRPGVISTAGAFHGRTAAALAMTGQPSKRAPFEPLPGEVSFVPFGDVDALTTAISATTSAVILEPIQGEGGVHPAPVGYLAAAREACDAAGALLIVDEVQTGIGRTGNWFASLAQGVVPDVMTLAKGLGGGLPIGAVIAFGDAAELFAPGDHGSTFGGNPVSCAAALAVIDTIESQGLLDHVNEVGQEFSHALVRLDHEAIAGVRGQGLLLAVALNGVSSAAVEKAARNQGFLVNAVAPDAIRLAPPLVITQDEIDEFVAALPSILKEASA